MPAIEIQEGVKLIPAVSPNKKSIDQMIIGGEQQPEMTDEKECMFVKRMIERAYADKKFEDPKIIKQIATGQRQINRNASILVISTIIKLLEKTIFVME